jgi:long-subunit acyl-CoA synthetase (AMP-forming)
MDPRTGCLFEATGSDQVNHFKSLINHVSISETRTVAKAFIKLGLERFHSVGILGFNSPEWFLADLGAVFAGGIATGIYPTNSTEACKYIAENCRANILVVEDEKQLEKILSIKDQLPGNCFRHSTRALFDLIVKTEK